MDAGLPGRLDSAAVGPQTLPVSTHPRVSTPSGIPRERFACVAGTDVSHHELQPEERPKMAPVRSADFGGGSDRSGLSTIIDAARNGGGEALTRLLKVAHVYCRLFAIERTPKSTSSKFDASDVGIVSLADVARDIRSFQGQSAEFFVWLRKIVRHNSIDLQRKHARAAENEVLVDSALQAVPARFDADPLLRMEEKERVEKAMSKLSEDHRAVLRLRVWERLKWEEIGQKLNRSADASRQLFARALDSVRGDLGEDGPSAARGA